MSKRKNTAIQTEVHKEETLQPATPTVDSKEAMTATEYMTVLLSQMDEQRQLMLLNLAEHIGKNELQYDNCNILTILPHLLKLQNTKETQYGRSWCKHEDFSAFFNVERKWDRIYNIMTKAMDTGLDNVLCDDNLSGTPTETFLDTVVDLGLYSLMWAGLIKDKRPEQFEKFLVNNGLKCVPSER